MANRHTGKEWFDIVREFNKSGLDEEAFAKKKKISVKLLKSWRNRFKQEREAERALPKNNDKKPLKEWRDLIKKYEESTISPYEFAKREGVKLSQIEYWKERLSYSEKRNFFTNSEEQQKEAEEVRRRYYESVNQSAQNSENSNLQSQTNSVPTTGDEEISSHSTPSIQYDPRLPSQVRRYQQQINSRQPPRNSSSNSETSKLAEKIADLKKSIANLGKIFQTGADKISIATKHFVQDGLSGLKKGIVRKTFHLPGLKQLDDLLGNSLSEKALGNIEERSRDRTREREYADRYVKYDPRAKEEMANGKSYKETYNDAKKRFSEILKTEKLLQKVQHEIRENEKYSIDTNELITEKIKLIEKISKIDKTYAEAHHNTNIIREQNQLPTLDRILNQISPIALKNENRVDRNLIIEEETKKIVDKTVSLMTSKEIRNEIKNAGLGNIGDQDIRKLREILKEFYNEEAKKLTSENSKHVKMVNYGPRRPNTENEQQKPELQVTQNNIDPGELKLESDEREKEKTQLEERQAKLLEEIRNELRNRDSSGHGNDKNKFLDFIKGGLGKLIGGAVEGISAGIAARFGLGRLMGAAGGALSNMGTAAGTAGSFLLKRALPIVGAGVAGYEFGDMYNDYMNNKIEKGFSKDATKEERETAETYQTNKDNLGYGLNKLGYWLGLNDDVKSPEEIDKIGKDATNANLIKTKNPSPLNDALINSMILHPLSPKIIAPKNDETFGDKGTIKLNPQKVDKLNDEMFGDKGTVKATPRKSQNLNTIKILDEENNKLKDRKSSTPVIVNAPTTNVSGNSGAGITIQKDSSVRPRENSFTKHVDQRYYGPNFT